MTYRHFKYEGWLYAFAFLLALALRLAQLGAMPLNDAEAAPALQALHIAQGVRPVLSPHPFYILSTSVLFFLYGGGTNFLARLIPALIGSLLVFAPLLFDNRLKPRPSLLLAFFIALDPGLTALSRQAASPIFALAFLLFAWAYIHKNKPSPAGFFAALTFLSGPSIWTGLLGLGITWAILQGFNFRRPVQPSTADPQPSALSTSIFNSSTILSFLVTFITFGTLFFIVPNGLSAALASMPAYINTWFASSDVSTGRLFLSLLVYQPLAFLLALIAIIRGWTSGSARIIPLSIWLFVSLLLAAFLPSRQISDLVWVLIPLYSLAALELARGFNIFPDERKEVIGVVLLTALIWLFAWLDFAGLVWLPVNSREYVMRIWLLISALILLVLSLLLVAAGWSIRTARLGGVWGLTLVLGVLGFGGTLGSAGLRGLAHPEFWRPSSTPMQADLLQATVREISEIGVGNEFSAPVVIMGINSPTLEWTLREHSVNVAESLDISSAPYFIVTPPQTDPVLVSAYRGQDFTWRQTPLWNAALSNDWIRWITLREMPQTGETIILWARDDLFLDK